MDTAWGREPAPFIKGRVPVPFRGAQVSASEDGDSPIYEPGEVHFYHPKSTSLGANDHVRYLSTRLDGKILAKGIVAIGVERKLLLDRGVLQNVGDVTVLKFQLPTFPNTENGQETNTSEMDSERKA